MTALLAPFGSKARELWARAKPWELRAAIAGGIVAAVGAVALLLVVRHYEADLPNVADLKVYQPPQVTRVLARDGSLLAEIFTQRRTVVSIDALPAHVKLAVLAAEDAGFSAPRSSTSAPARPGRAARRSPSR